MSHVPTARTKAWTCGLVVMSLWGIPGVPPGSHAQEPPTGPPVHIPSEERFTEQELHAFADAYPAVKDLTAQRRGGGKDRTADFTAERAGLIEKHGLSQDRYNRIATAMNRDPRLRDQIQRLIEDAGHE